MVGKYISEKIRLSIWLGAGTMGVVWRAEHLELGLAVAVKLMPSGSPDDAQLRFRNEAITAQRFKSPHIVRIFEHGRTNEGIPYLVMELLEGEDLRRHVQRVGPLPLAKVAGIFAQVTRALEEARNLDIVHRDIKPANLFLVESDGDPIVKVLDFGIAKQHLVPGPGTLAGSPLGTLQFMSPEQFDDPGGVDWRADLWSLAVTTYYVLLAQLPFEGASAAVVRSRIEHESFVLPSEIARLAPAGLDAWFQRTFARRPEDRFRCAREMAEELDGIASRGGDASLQALVAAGDGEKSEVTLDVRGKDSAGHGIMPLATPGQLASDRANRSATPEPDRSLLPSRERKRGARGRLRAAGALSALTILGIGLSFALLARPPLFQSPWAPTGCEVTAPLLEVCNPLDRGGLYCWDDPMLGYDKKKKSDTLYLCTKHRPGESDRPLLSVEKVCDFGCDRKDFGMQASCKSGRPGLVATKLERPQHLLVGRSDGGAWGRATHDSAPTPGLEPDIRDTVLDTWSRTNDVVRSAGQAAIAADVVPMFTYAVLSTALRGADADSIHRILTDEKQMAEYWRIFTGFLQEVTGLCRPVIIQLEPGLWDHPRIRDSEPRKVEVAALAADCAWLENETPGQAPYRWNMAGLGRCLLHLAHTLAPRSIVGYHLSPSAWADPGGRWPEEHLRLIGAADADILIVGTLDRDSLCGDGVEGCASNDGPSSWGDAEFQRHLDWAKGMGDRLDKPLLWWNVSLADPGDSRSGEHGSYRYFVERADRIAKARGLGVVFSAGSTQHNAMTIDGDRFFQARKAYRSSPTPLL